MDNERIVLFNQFNDADIGEFVLPYTKYFSLLTYWGEIWADLTNRLCASFCNDCDAKILIADHLIELINGTLLATEDWNLGKSLLKRNRFDLRLLLGDSKSNEPIIDLRQLKKVCKELLLWLRPDTQIVGMIVRNESCEHPNWKHYNKLKPNRNCPVEDSSSTAKGLPIKECSSNVVNP